MILVWKATAMNDSLVRSVYNSELQKNESFFPNMFRINCPVK